MKDVFFAYLHSSFVNSVHYEFKILFFALCFKFYCRGKNNLEIVGTEIMSQNKTYLE